MYTEIDIFKTKDKCNRFLSYGNFAEILDIKPIIMNYGNGDVVVYFMVYYLMR